MAKPKVKHPAPYTPAVLSAMTDIVEREADARDITVWTQLKLIDPMAGTGLIHTLPCSTTGIELEPEWADMHPDTIVGDARKLPFDDDTFDMVGVSPAYGNRFSDHHNARDGSRRRSYTHDIGRDLTPGNSGVMPYGNAYKELHHDVWVESTRVLKPRGLFILNCSGFIRDGAVVRVSEWHMNELFRLGYMLESAVTVNTPRMRFGANHAARVDGELVASLRAP